jgi:hypothetical protein
MTEIYCAGKIIYCDVGEINHYDDFCQKSCRQRSICEVRKQKEEVQFT